MSIQIEIHWSPVEQRHTGLIGVWTAPYVPRKGDLIYIDEPDRKLHVRVTSVRLNLKIGEASAVRLSVVDMDL